MKRRGLIVLAVVAAALGGLLLFESRRRSGGEGETAVGEVVTVADHARALPPFDRAKVRGIVIRRQHGDAVSMLHSPSSTAPAPAPAWHLEREGEPPADDAAVQDLLGALDLAESDRRADVAPEAVGLSPSVAEIALDTPTGTLTLQLGRVDPTGRGVYARAGMDAPVRVIGKRVLDLVDRDADAFRDRRLFPIDPAAVASISWRDAGGPGNGLSAIDGRWQNGAKQWVAGERVIQSLRQLQALRIEAFEPGPPPALPGNRRSLTLATGTARVALDIGPNGEIVRGGERVRVPAEAFEAAWRSLVAAAAPDDRLVSQAPDTVTRIDLFDDRSRVDLRRVRGTWTFSAPKVKFAADTRAVDDWLGRLASVKSAPRAEGGKPRHLIVEGRFRQQIDVAAPPDVYALLAPDPQQFRDRAVLSFARFDARGVTRTAGGRTTKMTSDDGVTWRAAGGPPPDPASVARVVGALADLRALEFVAAPPAGSPGVQLTIQLQQPGERAATHQVQVWPRNDGDCVARLDRDATFTLGRDACQALQSDLPPQR